MPGPPPAPPYTSLPDSAPIASCLLLPCSHSTCSLAIGPSGLHQLFLASDIQGCSTPLCLLYKPQLYF
uniref:Uncharacterized protein n=1 Tax=Macaca fascicularis TaxID=9541 RepID=Q9MZZ5_MACFA|nr:hypothetical protein [Macaca fascicularis]